MQVITITTEAYQQLIDKINAIAGSIQNPPTHPSLDLTQRWLDNNQLCEALRISTRTAQEYRNKSILPFSQFGSKIYYKVEDVENHLLNHYKK